LKVNLPITNTEKNISDGVIIISETDPKGITTFVDQDFVAISGYSEEELLGKSHNIVRHPDMPPAAFADLWSTIKQGKPWNGIVKNRCKNGDYYWVEANVTPIVHDGRITGYISVRTKPARRQVEAAAALYQKMKRGGKIPGPSFAQRIRNLGVKTLLIGLVGLLVVIPGIAALIGFNPLYAASINLVLALVVTPFAIATIVRPLNDLLTTVLNIQGRGDLTQRATVCCDNEIGQLAKAFNALILNFRGITRETSRNAETVSAAATQLSTAADQLMENTMRQSEAASSTAAAVEQVTVSIASVSDSVEETRKASHENLAHTVQGNVGVSQMVGEIDHVESSVQAIAQAVREFVQSTGQITAMTKEVRDIADQTNLLALNAAIEAARAGEQGRGFAVVADEVRKLAEKSAHSAREIDAVTQSIAQQSVAVETSIQTGLQHLTATQDFVEEFAGTLSQTKESVSQVTSSVEQIATAAREQSSASNEIARNVEKIAHMTENNAAAVAETSVAIHQLRDMAGKLRNSVGRFKV
jgi:aerotaxis receptor